MEEKPPKTNGPRIRELRKALEMTQDALARRMEVSGSAVSQWESGGGINLEHLPELARILRTTTDDIINHGIPVTSSVHSSVTRIDINGGKAVPLVALRGLTVQNMGARKSEAESSGSHTISDDPTSDDAVAFSVIDRSMEPEYRIGESVIIEPLAFEPGDHIVAHIKSQKITVFRQFEFDGADHRKLVPLNTQYQVLRFTNDEWTSDLEVLGVMVSHTRKRRSGHPA